VTLINIEVSGCIVPLFYLFGREKLSVLYVEVSKDILVPKKISAKKINMAGHCCEYITSIFD
jgi:hypothetical protein